MTTSGNYMHAIIEQGREEARKDGAASVEARHLLLAVAAGPDDASREVLGSAGLDYPAIREALEREFGHSLIAAGVSAGAFDLPQPASSPERPAHLGASARLAIERGFPSGGRKRDFQPAHLLIGILQAEVGTVPRALALAGIDRAGLAERALAAVGQ